MGDKVGSWFSVMVTAVGIAAMLTVGRRIQRPGSVAAVWDVAALAWGMLGMAFGQRIVDAAFRRLSDLDLALRIKIVCVGTRATSTLLLVGGARALFLLVLGGVLAFANVRGRHPVACRSAMQTHKMRATEKHLVIWQFVPFDCMAHSPRLSGFALSAAARLTRSRIGSTALSSLFRKELKVTELRQLPDHLRGPFPLDVRPLAGRPPRSAADAGLAPPRPPWSGSSATIAEAYRAGRTTPEEVADRALRQARALAARSPAMGPLMAYADDAARSEARASTVRWQAGKPIGPLDGVPTAIKEELCVRGFPWTRGTDIGDPSPRADDATVAARLRTSGAVILGITPMTEYGLTPTGINAKRTMPRNPHLSACMAGGSSTGAGVAVATGLVPFAIGADGGGSIRTPAALNGIFGIKPTWGRVSRAGGSSGSVAHIGPLASSTLDLARVIDAVSGPDPLDPETRDTPLPGGLERAIGRGVRGLVIGVLEQEFSDASPEVAKAGQMAIDALVKEGARIVSVATPLARYAPAIGYVTIAVEARAILSKEWREHADELTPDLQLTFATLDALTAPELLDAQRLRAGLRRDIARWFEEVDLLALPTTVATAGRVSDAEMATGLVDTRLLDGLCRFAFLANLTGLPAGSVPVALDREGLPIGFQLVGDAWDEATVLAAMAHLERIEAASVARPAVAVDRG